MLIFIQNSRPALLRLAALQEMSHLIAMATKGSTSKWEDIYYNFSFPDSFIQGNQTGHWLANVIYQTYWQPVKSSTYPGWSVTGYGTCEVQAIQSWLSIKKKKKRKKEKHFPPAVISRLIYAELCIQPLKAGELTGNRHQLKTMGFS